MATESAKTFAYAFSVFIGVVTLAIGALVLSGGQAGAGPCGRFCGLFETLLQFLGQPRYNLIVGLLWTIFGAMFIVLPWRHKSRRLS